MCLHPEKASEKARRHRKASQSDSPFLDALEDLRDCIVQGRSLVASELELVREHTEQARTIWSMLQPETGPQLERRERFGALAAELVNSDDPIRYHMGKTMQSFTAGLFVGGNDDDKQGNDEAEGEDGPDDLPADNLDLERAFRLPKAHARHIHGRAHAGTRIVQQGPTLALVLDAHQRHPEPFTREQLLPYAHAKIPEAQLAAERRQGIMRQARSRKKRGPLLSRLEKRFTGPLPPSSAT